MREQARLGVMNVLMSSLCSPDRRCWLQQEASDKPAGTCSVTWGRARLMRSSRLDAALSLFLWQCQPNRKFHTGLYSQATRKNVDRHFCNYLRLCYYPDTLGGLVTEHQTEEGDMSIVFKTSVLAAFTVCFFYSLALNFFIFYFFTCHVHLSFFILSHLSPSLFIANCFKESSWIIYVYPWFFYIKVEFFNLTCCNSFSALNNFHTSQSLEWNWKCPQFVRFQENNLF